MIHQWKFAARDLWKRKWLSTILLIQAIIMACLFHYTSSALLHLSELRTAYQQLTAQQPIYGLVNWTDETRMKQLIERNDVTALRDLYTHLPPQTDTFSLYTSHLVFTDKRLLSIDAIPHETKGQTYTAVPFNYANPAFFHYFNITLAAGRTFTDADYRARSGMIPVIVGATYKTALPIGTTIRGSDGMTYQIIGRLKRGANYTDFMASRDFISLDHRILLPIQPNRFTDSYQFDSVISRTYFATDDQRHVEQFIRRAASKNLYSFGYKRLDHQFQNVMNDKQTMLEWMFFLNLLVILFTVISFATATLQSLRKLQHELGIHLLVGAQPRDLFWRLAGQIIPFFIISTIVTFALFPFNGYALLAHWLIAGLLFIIPLLYVLRVDTQSLLRWKQL